MRSWFIGGRNVIQVKVNGESRRFPAPLTMRDLVEQLELGGRRIAVERNGAIIPRSEFEATHLADGDALEIVVAVGGG
jgi:sulfur carrier protein